MAKSKKVKKAKAVKVAKVVKNDPSLMVSVNAGEEKYGAFEEKVDIRLT